MTDKVMKLQISENGLIYNPDFELSKDSEVIAVQKIATMQFVVFFIINYKASSDTTYKNKLLSEVLESLDLNDECLFVRFNADDIITSNHLCIDKCVPKNIVEVISTYTAVLNVMSNIKATYTQPAYKLCAKGYYVEDGSFTLQDGSGDFSLAINLECCNFYLSEECSEDFSSDFPDCINWKIFWCSEKEHENTLLKLYKDEDFVLYLTNPSAWYDKHNTYDEE